ncbi:hypothetical protein ACFYYH_05035 [Streptomyces sp. NPDC002018]|uniref:hypothetical protein n=1 Tax=Streptomyces sp. NPDC002018 TaxID=3364629 RepID=UPI00368C4E18
MICNFLLSRRLEPCELAEALADVVRVPPGQVDVCAGGDEFGERDWEAFVLCTYRPVDGDVAMSLDIQVQPSTAVHGAPASEPELAVAFARGTGVTVLHPDDRIDPDTYWLTDPAGTVTRVRLLARGDGPTTYTVGTAEAAVAAFPGAEVTPPAEVLRSDRIPTPVATRVAAALGQDGPQGSQGSRGSQDRHGLHGHRAPDGPDAPDAQDDPHAQDPAHAPGGQDSPAALSLFVWERLGRRMESGWAPSGRYLPELYVEDLTARDLFDRCVGECAERERELLLAAVAELDELFRTQTEACARDVDGVLPTPAVRGDGWWWSRRPRRLPWSTGA